MGRRLSTARYMLTKEKSHDVDSSNATNERRLTTTTTKKKKKKKKKEEYYDDEEGIARPRYCTKIQISRSSRKTMTKKKKKKKEKKKKKRRKKKGRKANTIRRKWRVWRDCESILSFRQVKSCWANSLSLYKKDFVARKDVCFQ